MKFPFKNRFFWPATIVALTIVLLALALMQYHWSLAMSEAATARMRANLASSMIGFRQDFERELADLPIATQPGEALKATELTRYADLFQQWHRSARNSELVKGVYLWQRVSDKAQTSQLNLNTGHFEPANAPPQIAILGNDFFFQSPMHIREGGPMPFRHREGMMMRDGPPMGGPPRRLEAMWIVDPNIPALLRPISDESPTSDHRGPNPSTKWIIVELNRDFLRQQLFPQLAARYFSGSNGLAYDVAVIAEGHQSQVLYSSGGTMIKAGVSSADASTHLFGPPQGEMGMAFMARDRGRMHSQSPQMGSFGREPAEPIHFMTAGGDWRLIVKNKQGSLEAAAAGFRRKHLAMSSGVLLILAATMGIVLLASRRAQHLADLQMDFVAGVSHELRTPLAVITSAADNIFDGIVQEPVQLERYALVIKNQAQQLTQLIEQILLFAAARERKQQFQRRPLRVSDLIDAALGSTAELARTSGYMIEKEIQPDLPQVLGDFDALLHCLQNLVTNAVKYGGERGPITLRARASDGSAKGVEIVVEDHGLGIAKAELAKIFDPFYRSPAVIAAQIHGTGLGLPLARGIAEAMGGRLTVSSQIGKGSAFTLHLPVATEIAETSATETARASTMKTAGNE